MSTKTPSAAASERRPGAGGERRTLVGHERLQADAAEVLAELTDQPATLAVAESLTGGLLAATLTEIPGASTVIRGAVVAYASDVKIAQLGVDPATVATSGVVSAECARQMAVGVRTQLTATYALSTTGVAGPDAQEGRPPGTVFVGWAGPDGDDAEELTLAGDRHEVRIATCLAALEILRRRLVPAGTTRQE